MHTSKLCKKCDIILNIWGERGKVLYFKLKMFMTLLSDYMRIYGQRDVLLRTKLNNKLHTVDEYVNSYGQWTSIQHAFYYRS